MGSVQYLKTISGFPNPPIPLYHRFIAIYSTITSHFSSKLISIYAGISLWLIMMMLAVGVLYKPGFPEKSGMQEIEEKLTMTMFWEITIESKLLNQNQWSWYHSFQKTMFYLMKSIYAIFSNINESNKFRAFHFFWHTRYNKFIYLFIQYLFVCYSISNPCL